MLSFSRREKKPEDEGAAPAGYSTAGPGKNVADNITTSGGAAVQGGALFSLPAPPVPWNAMLQRGSTAFLAVVALALAGCAPGQQLPTGIEALGDLCPAYVDVVDRLPVEIDGDQVGDGAIPAGESAIAELRTETAQLRAFVEPLEATETRAAFNRFVQETASALSSAEREAQLVESSGDWDDVQRQLNETIQGADERLRGSMDDIEIDLQEACSS